MIDMMAAALSYAYAGVPVFPCAVGGKAPWTDNGFLDATTDQRTITAWWQRHPHANIAAPTGAATFDVLDVDVRDSGTGWEALETLRQAGLVDGWHRTIRTPSGGLHLHYPGTAQRSGSLGARHLDFRSEGGYVLLPPSLGQTKRYSRRYVLIDQRVIDARAFAWKAARELLAPAAASPQRRRPDTARAAQIEHLVAHVRKQREGNRNNVLYWAANRALDHGGIDLEPLVAAAVAVGLPENEAQRTIDIAVRRSRSAAAPSPATGGGLNMRGLDR